MLMLVLTWIGIAVGTTMLLLMALGPAIVELDGMLDQRRRDRRRAQAKAARQHPMVIRPATQL
jgi:hypothetical protein